MKYYLLGNSLKHSFSPFIHHEMGLDYEIMELPEEADFRKFLTDKDFGGCNVTIPYKITALDCVDYIDEVAERIGAINTVVKHNGRLYGYNTDAFGMEYALKYSGIKIENKTVMILGDGGTSKTANYVVKKNKAKEVIVVSRKPDNKVNYQNCYEYAPDVIINTTRVGMYPQNFEALVDLTRFHSVKGVFDVIYNPLKTNLIEQAENLDIPCGNGLMMLVAQAVKARDIFVDKKDGEKFIATIYKKLLYEKKNIIIIGMPGSGKTTVAEKLAEETGRKYLDTDKLLQATFQKTPEEIINKEGEEEFRKKEAEILEKALTSDMGMIIATGGGCVLRQRNRKFIKQSGFTVWIKRDIDKLSTDGRPLSKGKDALLKMEIEREKYYKACSNICIVNKENALDKAVEEIRREYEKYLGY